MHLEVNCKLTDREEKFIYARMVGLTECERQRYPSTPVRISGVIIDDIGSTIVVSAFGDIDEDAICFTATGHEADAPFATVEKWIRWMLLPDPKV